MKLLAVETATEACSAALIIDDRLLERSAVAPRQHTRLILPMIDELLQEAGISIAALDVIAFGQGPGAFTGVRIATGVIQGLAFAHDLPVVPISSLAALAQQQADEHGNIAVAIDARMQEVYWGLFQVNNNGLVEPVATELVCSPEDVSISHSGDWYGAGTGWQTYSEILLSRCAGKVTGYKGDSYPLAGAVARLGKAKFEAGEAIAVEQAAPVYLRNKVVN